MRSPHPRISARIKLPIIKYGKEFRRASIARPSKKLPTCRRYLAAHGVRTSEVMKIWEFSRPIPYVGFSHGTASSIRHHAVWCRAFRRTIEVKADPAMPRPGSTLYSALRRNRSPRGSSATGCGASAATAPPVLSGPRSRRVVLFRPSSLGDLIRQSEELRTISQHSQLHALSAIKFKGRIRLIRF